MRAPQATWRTPCNMHWSYQAVSFPESMEATMSIVKLLGFETLGCGCVVGHYRDAGTVRVVSYVEEKSVACTDTGHRRNHAVLSRRRASSPVPAQPPQGSAGRRRADSR